MIDENGIYSNDIYALLCAYGVEAARAAILREIGGVFAVYKIDVDIRHLELIADYMVRSAGAGMRMLADLFMPLCRRSMEDTSPSTERGYPQIRHRYSRRHTKPPQHSCPTPPSTATSMT